VPEVRQDVPEVHELLRHADEEERLIVPEQKARLKIRRAFCVFRTA
jgi:hypothetical protein